MVAKELIKEIVAEKFAESLLEINEIELYRMTSDIPKQGLRRLVVFNELILYWIKQVVNSDKETAIDGVKVEIIKEILNEMDKLGEEYD